MSETHPPAQQEEHGAVGLAIAQFLVTAVLLGLVATLAYLAGMRSAGKESGGGANASASGPAAHVDVATLLKPSPDLVAKGKALFAVNCASCHGPEGFGNGPASSALNPKPRNFHETYMRYGGGVARIVQTVSTGSPGTAMAAFTNIPLEDRFALAHYVRTFMPKPPEDKPEDLAWLGPLGGPGGGGTGAQVGGPAKPTPSIPIELALKLIQEPSPAGTLPGMGVAAPPSDAPGATLYGQRCASCHGGSGEGGVRVRMLGSSPYAYVTTQSFSASRSAADPAAFEKLVLQGIPGYVMPGSGDLSKDEIRQLYEFTSGLRSKQPQATPAAAPAASAAPHATTPASQGGTRS
jgi:mono/diheme cytochrome c family protein